MTTAPALAQDAEVTAALSALYATGAPPQDCCSQEEADADADPTATPTTIPQDVIGSLLTSLVQAGGTSAVVYDDGPEGGILAPSIGGAFF